MFENVIINVLNYLTLIFGLSQDQII